MQDVNATAFPISLEEDCVSCLLIVNRVCATLVLLPNAPLLVLRLRLEFFAIVVLKP